MSFHTHIYLCERNHHHNQDIHHFQKFFCALCYLSFPTATPDTYSSVLCHCNLFVSIRVLYKCNHIVCTLCLVYFSIYSYFKIYSFYYMYQLISIVKRSYYMTILQLAYPFMFPFLAIIHELLWTCVYKSLTYSLPSSNIQQFT